jgi:hypothetical protein
VQLSDIDSLQSTPVKFCQKPGLAKLAGLACKEKRKPFVYWSKTSSAVLENEVV